MENDNVFGLQICMQLGFMLQLTGNDSNVMMID